MINICKLLRNIFVCAVIRKVYIYFNIKSQQPQYNLRHTNDITPPRPRTTLYSSSFLPRTIQEWNNLPEDVRTSTTIEAFKASLNRTSRRTPKYYNSGTRLGQILHARLRLGCSSLNQGLYRISIVETPLCTCGSVENVSHYLLTCSNYMQSRQQFLSDIPCPRTLNNLLFGNEHLSLNEITILFGKVQKFILSTKRFDT